MIELLMATLPLSLAAAVSVSSILVFFAILVAKEKQLEHGFAFVLGGISSYAAIAAVVIFSCSAAAPPGSPHHPGLHAGGDFILSALCILLAIKEMLKKADPGKEKKRDLPGGAVAYFGIGALMRGASANTRPPFIAAVKDVSGAHLSSSSSMTLYLMIILVSMAPMIIPLLIFMFNREKAVALILPVNNFLEKNKKRISITVLVVIAFYLALHGFHHLRG
ncbi:MAG: GAP family protein [Deltaproteobacteria bacterium]